MRKSDNYMLLTILLVFVAFITLGGLGNAAVSEPFYWVPFVLNVVVYVAAVAHTLKLKKSADKDEVIKKQESLNRK